MIKATPGARAVFTSKGHEHLTTKRWAYVGSLKIELPPGTSTFEKSVEAWGDDLEPLIVGDRGLEDPRSASNFIGIRKEDDPSGDSFVQIIPGDGWIIWGIDGSEPSPWVPWPVHVLAFGLDRNGSVYPITADSTGSIDKWDLDETTNFRHVKDGPPDQEWINLRKSKGTKGIG